VPRGKNILRGKWVFDDKRDERGRLVKYKARFVAKGYTQQYGEDYEDTFAGVVIAKSFRIMLSMLNADATNDMEHWGVWPSLKPLSKKNCSWSNRKVLSMTSLTSCANSRSRSTA